MKHVVGVSLGSSLRNHSAEIELLGTNLKVERIGTDGSIEKAIELIKELDGKVDAFGLGGIDLYIYAGKKRFTFKDAKKIAAEAKKTPIVDGSGLKNTLEREVIKKLTEGGIDFSGAKVLMVCGADRFGMAEALYQAGAKMTFGDLIFALGIPIPITSLKTLIRAISAIAPIACNLPFKMLYPTGGHQEKTSPRYYRFFKDAEIIAGDFHYIKRYMPDELKDKTIITNTITTADLAVLKDRGVKKLITTTPEIKGRSFGTNVMEGILVALLNDIPEKNKEEKYFEILAKLNFSPRIVEFDEEQKIV